MPTPPIDPATRVALIGRRDHAAAIQHGLRRIRDALASSETSASNGHPGLGDCVDVIRRNGRETMLVRLRDDTTVASIGGAEEPFEVTISRMPDTCGTRGDRDAAIASALRHVDAAIAVLDPGSPDGSAIEDLVARLAEELAYGGILHGRAVTAIHATVVAPGPFCRGTSGGFLSLVGPSRRCMLPDVPRSIGPALASLGPSAHACVENAGVAIIDSVMATTDARNDALSMMRHLASTPPREWSWR